MVVGSLSHQGNPRILEWVAYPLLQGSVPTWESNQYLLHCRQDIYQLSYSSGEGCWLRFTTLRN